MHGIGRHFGAVEVKDLGEYLERKPGGNTTHAFVHPCVVAVLLVALGTRVGVFEAFTVVDLHFAVQAGVFWLFEACEDGELAHHLERSGGAFGFTQ